MRRMLKFLALPATILFGAAAPALAQPTISSIFLSGTSTPGYGGAGPNSPTTFDIVGTGFSTTPKQVRFVDANNNDVLSGATCSSTTSCTTSGVRPYRLPAGSLQFINVFALVDSGAGPVKSVVSAGFRYYGEPVVNSVVPNTGPLGSSTPYTLNGGPWTRPAFLPPPGSRLSI